MISYLLVRFEQSNTDNLVIHSDKRILKNVLFNLISNAIKYSEEDSKIFCRIFQEGEETHIEVQDYGIGIPENEQKYLFERFFRASNVETIQGTGLGLNIVKRYIELLGGKITFSSNLGEGTTFKIVLPTNKV